MTSITEMIVNSIGKGSFKKIMNSQFGQLPKSNNLIRTNFFNQNHQQRKN